VLPRPIVSFATLVCFWTRLHMMPVGMMRSSPVAEYSRAGRRLGVEQTLTAHVRSTATIHHDWLLIVYPYDRE